MHLRWPFVGREAELDHVAGALAARQGVVLAGEAGVGKSRLLAEAIERAVDADTRALTVRATRSSGVVPLGAFAPLLPVDDAAASLAGAREAILARAPALVAMVERDPGFVFQHDGIAGREADAVDGDLAANDVHVGAPSLRERVAR